MANQLRLDVAQLTDVGRKREHNEDNMAYVIPKDPQVMTKKGALFIVADGMGGHAAGEVASEIAVDTVSNAYYQDDSDDVASSLVRAIRRANAAIHQRAAENMLRSGMGTTCVAAILRGNRAYIANVGDSRAYLLRNTTVKQVSQDHSWVAEQVRAGLLTDDQARTHAQRNVITRCLGTQAEVEIDVFSEELTEGDSLVLCTDGLSGLVSDEELQRIVNQYVPQESVYHLVERANENGGPDNITAIVVRVQEVGVEPPGVRYPVSVGGRETGTSEDTTILSLLPGAPGDALNQGPTMRNGQVQVDQPAMGGGMITRPLRISSGPLASPDNQSVRELAPTPGTQATYPSEKVPIRKRNRLFYPSLTLLIVVVLALVAGGIYYFIHKSQDVQQVLTDAQQQINSAKAELVSNPANPVAALQQLADAQNDLRKVQKNHQLSTAQNQQMSALLMSLGAEVRTAIDAYNTNAMIKVLPCGGKMPAVISNGSVFTHLQSVASVHGKSAPWLYALGEDGNVYWLKGTTTYSLQSSMTLPANVHVVALTGDGNQLFLLEATPSGYMVNLYKDPAGNLGKPTSTVTLSSKFTQQNSKRPIPVITASNAKLYVLLKDAGSNALLLTYSVTNNQLTNIPEQLNIFGDFVGMAAMPNTLFLLLAGGAIKSLPLPPQSQPLDVLAKQIAVPVPNSDVSFDPFKTTMSVPVPQQQNTSPLPLSLTVAGATALSTADVNGTSHLYISDPVNHRVIDLTVASPNGVASTQPTGTSRAQTPSPTPRNTAPASTVPTTNLTLQLFQQVVSSTYFNQVMSVAVDPQVTTVSVLVQMPPNSSSNNSSSFGLISLSTDQQTNCTTQVQAGA